MAIALVCSFAQIATLWLTRNPAGVQTTVMQNLQYFEHLSEPMAELVHILAKEFDYPQLGEEVLRFALLALSWACLV